VDRSAPITATTRRNAQALEQEWRFIAPDRSIPASCPANLT